MTEVNKLVAFSPPLRFPLFAPVPLFSRTANGVSSSTPVGFREESRNNLSVPGATGFAVAPGTTG